MPWGDHEFRPCGRCRGDAYGGTIEAGPKGPRLICRPCYRKARLQWEKKKAKAAAVGNKDGEAR